MPYIPGETGLVECHRGLTSGRDDIGLFHLDVAGGDNPFEGHTAFFISRVFQPGGNHHLGTRQLRQVVTHPGVWINFDNTNRYADFYVNGVKLSGTPESTKDVSGHMMRTRYDITDILAGDGRNAVAVLITDADQKKSRKGEGPYGVARL
mgnify:CR=1 FL=1